VRAGLVAASALAVGLAGARGYAQDPLEALDRAARDVVDRCAPSVVRIEAEREPPFQVAGTGDEERRKIEDSLRRSPLREVVSAAGFLVDESGLVLTTSAVAGGAKTLRVLFPDGAVRSGEFLGEDGLSGVALVRVAPVEGLKALHLSERAVRSGVLTLFLAPQEGDAPALHLGFVTSARRAFGIYDAWLVSSVPLEAGHAGAPLLDARGEVLGMAVAPRVSITVRTVGPAPRAPVTPANGGRNLGDLIERDRTVERGPAFSTFVPAAELRRISADLLAHGRVRKGLLGVRMFADRPEVTEVPEGLPAAGGGILAGDVILAVDGVPVTASMEVTGFIQRRAPGTAVRLKVRAPDGREREATVVLAESTRGAVPRALFKGLGVVERETFDHRAATFQVEAVPGGRFVVAESVDGGSAAGRAGVRPGDWIVEIGGRAVLSLEDFTGIATGDLASASSVELLIYRAGETERRRVVLK